MLPPRKVLGPSFKAHNSTMAGVGSCCTATVGQIAEEGAAP